MALVFNKKWKAFFTTAFLLLQVQRSYNQGWESMTKMGNFRQLLKTTSDWKVFSITYTSYLSLRFIQEPRALWS